MGNSFFGEKSGLNLTTGTQMESSFNLLIGENAGRNLTTGHHNIYLGKDAGMDETYESYTLRLGAIYKKEMTYRQWEKLYAALKWIIAGDDSGIDPEKITTGADSTFIGTRSSSKVIGTSGDLHQSYFINNKRVSKEEYEEAQRKPK